MKGPLVDGRSEADILRQIERMARAYTPEWRARLESDDPGAVLYRLYAAMLYDTLCRLNRVPEKHRRFFYNAQRQERLAARPAKAAILFEAAPGAPGGAVHLPAGTELSAGDGQDPLIFALCEPLDVLDCALLDVFYCDGGQDVVHHICEEGGQPDGPFPLFERAARAAEDHVARFAFQDIFSNIGGPPRVWVHLSASLDGQPFDSRRFADGGCFAWWLWDGGGQRVRLTARPAGEGVLALEAPAFESREAQNYLCLSLLDGALAEITLHSLAATAAGDGQPPEAVELGENQLEPEDFYPFGSPLAAYSDCILFCEEALSKRGAEITVQMEVALEEALWEAPVYEEQVDFRWVMRRPLPKRELPPAIAAASVVGWEYWNGAGYRALPITRGAPGGALASQGAATFSFTCPRDLTPFSPGGRAGRYVRLHLGGCDALYQLPHKTLTPRIQNFSFSWAYRTPVNPVAIETVNFGVARTHAPGPLAPFTLIGEREAALYLGFDGLPPARTLRLLAALDNYARPHTAAQLHYVMPGEEAGELFLLPLRAVDGTHGLCNSGILTVQLPHDTPPAELFGLPRCWLRLCAPQTAKDFHPLLRLLHPNAQYAENLHTECEQFTFSDLQGDMLTLAHQNLVSLKVEVIGAQAGAGGQPVFTPWEKHAGGPFTGSCYRADAHTGHILFPPNVLGALSASPAAYLVCASYTWSDGARANVGPGGIARLRQEVPFIKSAGNPLPATGGEDSESDERMALRLRHTLQTCGRAVSTYDYERMAKDLCPQVYDVVCVPGLLPDGRRDPASMSLAALLLPGSPAGAFLAARLRLEEALSRVGCGDMTGMPVYLFEALPAPVRCDVWLRMPAGDDPSGRLHQLQEGLEGFFDPVLGGLRGTGWKIGRMPRYKHVSAYLARAFPDIDIDHLYASITVQTTDGPRTGELGEAPTGPFHAVCLGEVSLHPLGGNAFC